MQNLICLITLLLFNNTYTYNLLLLIFFVVISIKTWVIFVAVEYFEFLAIQDATVVAEDLFESKSYDAAPLSLKSENNFKVLRALFSNY